MASTGKKRGRKILGLLDVREAEAFLVDCANLRPDYLTIREVPVAEKVDEAGPPEMDLVFSAEFETLTKKHPAIFAPFGNIPTPALVSIAPFLRTYLRKAWDAQDSHSRQWFLYELSRHYRDAVIRAGYETEGAYSSRPEIDLREQEPPPLTPLEAALFYLRSIGDRAKRCGNELCPNPYFIAAKRQTKHCSEKCAGEASRESKRRWWHDNRGRGTL